jgi:hypothetical protein
MDVYWISMGPNLYPCPLHELLDIRPMKSMGTINPPYPCPWDISVPGFFDKIAILKQV